MIGDKLKIAYGGVECGFVTLRVNEGFNAYEFIFDETLSDPFPKLVNMFARVRNGESCSENLVDAYDRRIAVMKISARVEGNNVFLTIELVKKEFSTGFWAINISRILIRAFCMSATAQARVFQMRLWKQWRSRGATARKAT